MAVEAHAIARGVRTSAQKAGLVCTLIRGKNVNQALATLQFTPKTIARELAKVLRSAVANIQQADGFGGDVERLYVSACYANQGQSAKRVRPAPMGRAYRVVKRTAHLTVKVSERPLKIVATGGDGRQTGSAAAKPARAKKTPAKAGGGEGIRRQRGSESSPLRIPARLQQDLALALVLRPRLPEAAARGSGAARRTSRSASRTPASRASRPSARRTT